MTVLGEGSTIKAFHIPGRSSVNPLEGSVATERGNDPPVKRRRRCVTGPLGNAVDIAMIGLMLDTRPDALLPRPQGHAPKTREYCRWVCGDSPWRRKREAEPVSAGRPAKPFMPRKVETSPKWLRMWLLTSTLSIQPLRRGLPNASISSSSVAGSRPATKASVLCCTSRWRRKWLHQLVRSLVDPRHPVL